MNLQMHILGTLFAVMLTLSVTGQERLVLPPHVAEFAKAHHCQPVLEFVADEESDHEAPYDFGYEFHHGPPKALFAEWCTRGTSASKGPYTLLIGAERSDHPLRSCPDEIPNRSRIGHPSIEAGPMIPHDFVMIDTGERLPVREPRIMFGVRNHVPRGSEFYACVAGKWAYYSPEK
jgi:hypothetical protein